jgi:hypothetical protein
MAEMNCGLGLAAHVLFDRLDSPTISVNQIVRNDITRQHPLVKNATSKFSVPTSGKN